MASMAAASCSGDPTANGCPPTLAEPIEKAASAGAPMVPLRPPDEPGQHHGRRRPHPRAGAPPTAEEDRAPSSSMAAPLVPPKTVAASPTVRSPRRVTASERRGPAWASSWPTRTNSPAGAASDRSASGSPLESARVGSGTTGGAPARLRKRLAAPADIVADSPRAASPDRSTVEVAKPASRLRPADDRPGGRRPGPKRNQLSLAARCRGLRTAPGSRRRRPPGPGRRP